MIPSSYLCKLNRKKTRQDERNAGSRSNTDSRPDPWVDPLDGEEWTGLRWIIVLLVRLRSFRP